MFTFRQYRANQKSDLLRTFPVECRAAAALLGDDLKALEFAFASVFHEPGGILAGVRIEFKTLTGDFAVWVDVMQGEPRKVLDQRGMAP